MEQDQVQSVTAKDYGTFFLLQLYLMSLYYLTRFFLYLGPCQGHRGLFTLFSQLWKTLLEFTCYPFQVTSVFLGPISF